jgi:lipopolysaccharide transport system ATP-binding protein
MAVAVRIEEVWKAYPRWEPGTRTLRGYAGRRLAHLRRRETRWALRDVSFDLQEGQSAALIGLNGAGKSTLLRLASGIGRATRGSILVAGETASVLSLGDTFDLELTGRENALTAALLAGIPLDEARARLPAILEFAELEAFADAPVRTYSDGMRLRLAFGVIAQLEPSLLLLDEVIAVGDLRFQEKCLAHVRGLRERGTSVLLASHSLDDVEEQCDVAIWLQAGAVRAVGEASAVVDEYRNRMHSETLDLTPPQVGGAEGEGDALLELRRNRFGSQELTIEDVQLTGEDGLVTSDLAPGGSLEIAFTLRPVTAPIEDPVVGVTVHRAEDGLTCCSMASDMDQQRLGTLAGPARVGLRLDALELVPGRYFVDVGAYQRDWAFAYDYHYHVYPLTVRGAARSADSIFLPAGRRWTVTRA